MRSACKSLFFALALFGSSSSLFAMGSAATVFELGSPAAIWDHSGEFYLRLDLSELSDLKNKTFLWAGFHQAAANLFEGEVVSDQFGKNEKRFRARAKLLETTDSNSYYRIEIFGETNEPIKEFFLKGPVRPAGQALLTQ